MKFAIVIKQDSEGCDYTIGCGMQLMMLKATTLAEARQEAKQLLMGDEPNMLFNVDCINPPQPKMKYVKVVQIEEDLPIGAWFDELVAERQLREHAVKEAQERAEFERLKGKFG